MNGPTVPAPTAPPGPVLPALRVAAWQTAPVPGDVAGNLASLDDAAARAADAGAHLLVTPEMALTGYAIGAGAVAALAEPADGAMAQAVRRIAMQRRIAIAYGYPEHCAGGQPYNAAQLVDERGAVCAPYRKTHLFGALDRAQFSAGDALAPPVTLHGWRLALLICYDVEFPEAVRQLALAGADAVLVPTANMDGFDVVADTLVPARAYENQLFVVYANHCGGEGEVRYGGLSTIAGPSGRALQTAGRTEALIVADLDAAALAATRGCTTYLADRRPALYAAGFSTPE